MTIHIGIDPGVSGGIAVIDAGARVWVTAKIPETDRELLDLLRPWSNITQQTAIAQVYRATLERVHSMPRQGHNGAFTFGKSVGRITMALAALHIPVDQVTPAKWQKALGCLSGGDKRVTKRRAQELFPEIAVTHAIADALLLAEYGRRYERGILNAVHSQGVHDGKEGKGRAQAHTEARGEDEGIKAGGARETTDRKARAASRGTNTPRTRRTQGSRADAARSELRR